RPCTPNLLVAVTQALEQLRRSPHLTGDYLEFGIFRGFTLWYAQQIANLLQVPNLRYFGFDSFFGLPEIKNSKDVSEEFSEGAYACSKRKVEEHFNQYGIDWKKTFLIEGFY